jgi:Family of unknown function (DUF6353)
MKSNLSFLSEAAKKVGSVGTNHPSAFFAIGIAAAVTSTVMACRSTLKLEETLAEFEVEPDPFYDSDAEDLNRNRIRAGIAVARLYAPAVIVGVASITMLTKSHSTLVKRNAALSAAYTALDNGFRDYRSRVVEKYGKDEDDRLRYGFETEKIKVGGKQVKTDRVDQNGASIYAVFFDEYNPNWSKDPEINKLFLRSQQNYLNDLLHARGHLFLNEALDSLGFDHTQAGAVVGWRLSDDGDNYVDLGIFNADDPDRIRDFVNGRESSVLLDFNVDGLIFDKIGNKPKPEIRWQATRWFRA